MTILHDFQGVAIRLTDERRAHILEHPEMVSMEAAIEETLRDPHQERSAAMADDRRRVKIWYDSEGDYLEVTFDQKPGYFRETESDQVMEKVDDEGNVLGFSVLRVSATKVKPLEVAL